MGFGEEVERGIAEYLEGAEEKFSDLPEHTRREMLQRLDNRIREALAARRKTPTLDDLNAVLSRLKMGAASRGGGARQRAMREGLWRNPLLARALMPLAAVVPAIFVALWSLSDARRAEEIPQVFKVGVFPYIALAPFAAAGIVVWGAYRRSRSQARQGRLSAGGALTVLYLVFGGTIAVFLGLVLPAQWILVPWRTLRDVSLIVAGGDLCGGLALWLWARRQ